MISIEERKIALLIQAKLIKKELDNLKRPEYRELNANTYTDHNNYAGLMALADILECRGK